MDGALQFAHEDRVGHRLPDRFRDADPVQHGERDLHPPRHVDPVANRGIPTDPARNT